jgi:serine/threonine protein kinase/superfamily I DNA/RNA helicase
MLMTRSNREIILGRYALLGDPLAGGMASVYKARDLENDELVAIKRFDRDRLLPELEAEAFRREVEALRNLIHPNILKIYDSGEDAEGRPFLVLEWMSHDLVEHHERRASAFKGWDDFADQVALPLLEGLAHAHANGYCHRDVKPANVLLADDGTVKLADFGISKLRRCLQPRITLNEFVSRPYAPPEPDDGAYSYARDVYGFAVLCLWTLAEQPVREYEHLAPALEQLDVVPEVRQILARCLCADPKERPQTAGVLSHEFANIQARRRQVWMAQDRKSLRVRLTQRAREALAQHVGASDPGSVQKFVEQDLNDEATVTRFYSNRGTAQEQVVPNNYFVYGAQFSYHIAVDNRGGDDFVVLSARAWEPHSILQLKEGTLPAPLTFNVIPRPGSIKAKQAVQLLEETIATFEEQQQREEAAAAEEALFTTWKNVLEARSTFERERFSPITFSSAQVNGQFVILQVEGDLSGVEPEQPRVVEVERMWFPGVVYEVGRGRIILNCPRCDLSKFPCAGRARFDTRAADIAIDRQRSAVEAIRVGGAVRGDLRSILLDPRTSRPPGGEVEEFKVDAGNLDLSQREAIRAALATQDLLLVQGPPGTGKTRFIAHLVRETLARDPAARILLTSQTHVAIDNALESLSKAVSGLKLLRIARQGTSVVAQTCQPFLVENQLERWRQEVASGTASWLRDWALDRGLNPDEIAMWSLLRQIAHLRVQVAAHRQSIQDREEKIAKLRRNEATSGPEESLGDRETFEREAEEFRDQLDSDKRVLEQREGQFRKARKDADEFLGLRPEEMVEWYEAFVGANQEMQQAAALLDLHAQWLERFGHGTNFLGALCERSDVVAATCIGLASLPGAGEVTYDLCIVDEASKATATEVLVPMVRAKRWVFVGDSKQLPPFEDEVHRDPALRQRFEIDSEDATESLFERLRRLLPQECQRMLKKQYRMVPPIGRLISECFYDGEVESAVRPLDARLTSVTGRAVTWVTTRYLEDRREERAEESFVNPVEVDRILDLLSEFEEAVNDSEEPVSVLLLSGYSAQVRLLERSIDRSQNSFPRLDVKCSTIDTVQGREADVVIFSVTRSNATEKAGFLAEFARINVALSRAREALVIVGDDEFVRRVPGAEPLRRALLHIERYPADCVFQSFDPPGSRKGSRR